MPRASKRGRPSENEAGGPLHLDLGIPLQTSSSGKCMRREDSSEAASAITLTPPLLLHKGTLEASTYALPNSQSAQSSQGGETPHQHILSHDLGHPQLGPLLLDCRKQAAWPSVREALDKSVASLLADKATDTTHHKQALECHLRGDTQGSFYFRYSESEEVEPVTRKTEFKDCQARTKEEVLQYVYALMEDTEGTAFGSYWQKTLQPHIHRKTEVASSIEEVTASLAAVVPEDLQPVTDAGRSSSWLSFSDAGRAATDLRLYVGSSFWTSGFSKHPAGLRPVYFSVQQGSRLKVLRQEQNEEGHRAWVLQEDQGALAAAELLLRAWRSQATGREPTAVAHTWEEVDSRAAVFGPRNELGAACEVVQLPGQLLSLQRQGHCSTASSGVFLSWNVAYGADWPGQALHEGKVRANAVRRAAATVKNAWLGSELKQKSHPLHVLRLLFAVACDIDRADCTLVEGLQEAFLPLCRLDIELQSKCSLPHMNAKKGILESRNGSGLRCSCCSGEFLFSFVCLVKRKGERGGSLCWQCWSQREAFGLQQDCRNARKCTVLQNSDLERLISAVSMSRASKRAKLED